MRLHERIESRAFQLTVGAAIVLCAIVVGLESSHLAVHVPAEFFRVADVGLTLFFAAELLVRIGAERRPWFFFRVFAVEPRRLDRPRYSLERLSMRETGFWNVFDFTVTGLGVLALVVSASEHADFLFAARLLRIFRVLRLFELGPQLRRIEKQIVAVIPTVFSFILLLTVLLYVFAIFGTQLFADSSTEQADFSSVEHSFLTLFQVMTLDNWSDVMHAVQARHAWLGPIYFLTFIVFTAIVSLNVFIAMLSHQVEEAMAHDETAARQSLDEVRSTEHEILGELGRLREQLVAMEQRLAEGRRDR